LVKTAGFPVILNWLLTGQPVFFLLQFLIFFIRNKINNAGLDMQQSFLGSGQWATAWYWATR